MLDLLAGSKLLGSWPGIVAGIVLVGVFWILARPGSKGNDPASLPDRLPGVWNSYQFVFHNMRFLQFARDNLKGRTIMKFWLGPQGSYLVTGPKNVQSVLRNSGTLSSNELFLMAVEHLDGASKEDVNKFRADKSGRSHVPSGEIGQEGRLWAPNHQIFAALTTSATIDPMTDKFVELFSKTIEQFPKSKIANLYNFIQRELSRCAIIALSGEEILKQNPNFVEAMWTFDSFMYPLILGVPRFLYPKAYRARDAFHEMGEKFLNAAWEKFDWNGPESEADWEPIFGTRFHRTHAKFLKDRGFALRSRSGLHIGSTWALNANCVPITAWALIEIIKDKALFQAVRDEATTALDSTSKEKKLDIKKLRDLPLLQSIFTETLRLHVAINITRNVDQDMVLDGYNLKKGYLVQAPSSLSHLDEGIWSHPGHPASGFWAERHLTYVEKLDENGKKTSIPQFSMGQRSASFFPFGGGISICPGRHFGKQEVMAAIALFVLNFDIELVEYVKMDGSKSDRGPKDDPWYCGTAAMPPDRDLKIRLTKV